MKISFKLFEKSRRDEIIVARHISAGSEARAQIEFRQERHHRMPFLTELRRRFCSLIPSTHVLGYCSRVPDGTFLAHKTLAYQITQRSFAARTIASPSLHWNAAANCGRFESGPLTRNLGNGCGSVFVNSRASSGRMLVAQP